jgi:hypothetical protein
MLAALPRVNADRANRPEGTRPKLPSLAAVQEWFGANPPGWLRNSLTRLLQNAILLICMYDNQD